MKYPQVKRVEVSDDYHGTTVNDPYRYMEDPEDPETMKFVTENNKLVENYFTNDEIEYFSNTLRDLLDYEKFYVPVQTENGLFYARQKPSELQPVIYKRIDSREIEVLDINKLSEDGTTGSMMQYFSSDGKTMAALITDQGSDWQKIQIIDIENSKHQEKLIWVTMSPVAWNEDNTGIYYTKYPDQTGLGPEEQRREAKLYFHKIGTDQVNDELIFTPESKEEGPTPNTFDNGKYLFISLGNSTLPENRLLFRQGNNNWVWLVDKYDGYNYIPIDIINNELYLQTSWNADNNRLMKINLESPKRENWEEIIPETDDVIRGVKLVNNQIVVTYEQNVKHIIKIFDLSGKEDHTVELPSYGQLVSGSYNPNLTGRKSDTTLYFGFTSFDRPMTVYSYDLSSKQLIEFLSPGLDIDVSEIDINQVFYESADGTKIPMYLMHNKDIKKDGKNPTYLYGYGGFNISLLPSFSSQIFAWVMDGGIYAIANLRGGGEYGKKWHSQALLSNKQNVFDDFICAAEYLINENYTNSSQIGINGRSNGGLLVGATLTQRPDLFGAAIPQVGVLDMLRFPIQNDAGRYWVKEYGNAKENQDHFKFLMEYSPYHNVKNGIEYPATLVTAAEGDDRVAPAHSKKFGAALQYAQEGDEPILVRIETKAGHGYGKPISKIVEDTAINLAFFKKKLSK